MNDDLKRNIILDHYYNPLHKGLVNDDSYIKVNVNNESCIDNIDLMVKIEDNVISDIRFDGEACAISTSATSIMIKMLLGKTIEETLQILKEYEKMINEEIYNADIIDEAIVYNDIYKQPNRKKCALLPWRGLKKVLKEK
ncbi:MAG: SUF system NifU family Fe-S cluster assembly protein [Bacilli bacterium]|jgi:nitrogen fixation NifU-like protein|nr:SUF system NifU family Fe-S cluster assembly protein [Bacilli bacterium]